MNKGLAKLSRLQSESLYRDILKDNDVTAQRQLCREDLYFLMTVGCKRADMRHDWIYARCREVENEPNQCLDLWAREHYKSTIITFGKTIQDILASHGDDPLPAWNEREATFGIFSHTKGIARDFLDLIRTELADNTYLQSLFPDILYAKPESESPSWSRDGGLTVKRESNPREATVEAWGLVDGQPTGKHFVVLVYDDVVTLESVTTPEMIIKVGKAWEMSLNLGTDGGYERYIGTRYHANDTYQEMIDKGLVKVRIHTPTDEGQEDTNVNGKPLLKSLEYLKKKRKAGLATYCSQQLQNPFADKAIVFDESWLRHYERPKDHSVDAAWNVYIVVDPASKKNKSNDYTVMIVVGLGPDNNYYIIDAVRDRMNLTERTDKLFDFVEKYNPIRVGYEEYGLQADIEHIEYVMRETNYRFNIQPVGGKVKKETRIEGLQPVFEFSRMWMPWHLSFVDYEKIQRDFTYLFITEEYKTFPLCSHDDMLDCLARILNPALGAKFPKAKRLAPKFRAEHARQDAPKYDPLKRRSKRARA